MAEVERLVERYRAVLGDEMGLTVHAVDESTLAFETGGLNLLIFLEDRDPEYLHLVAVFPPPEQELGAAELNRMCNLVTKEAKVAKVVTDDDGDLIVSAEMIVAGPDLMPTRAHLAAVLPRVVTAVFNAVSKITMSLELHGISQAVYDGDAGDLDGPAVGDNAKHSRARRRPRRKQKSDDGEDAAD
jgi:hypothetical protein